MIVSKYNPHTRNKFVITTMLYEDLKVPVPRLGNCELDYIEELLIRKYQELLSDNPPYHIIIKGNDYRIVKDPHLKHSSRDFLKPYNDDIKILIIAENVKSVSDASWEVCSNVIADLSIEFCNLISSNIVIPELMSNSSTLIKSLEIKSITKRNIVNPLFIICELVLNGKLYVSEYVVPVRASIFKNSIKNVSSSKGVSVQIIENMNPHLSNKTIRGNDIMFIPRTIGEVLISESLTSEKEAEFNYNRCKFLLDNEEAM